MAWLASAMAAHAAVLKHDLHVAHHVRVAAKHHMRILRGQRHARPGLEPTVANGLTYSSRGE